MTDQSWQAKDYADHASFVSELGSPVVALLAPVAGERILDLGCGDGTLAAQIQRVGASVLGVDASQSMVDAASKKGVEAQLVSGEKLAYNNEFDAVFSNAALHWMTDYRAVIRGVHTALKAGGRFVGELGGRGNIQCLLDGMETVCAKNPQWGPLVLPWYFPSEQEYAAALEAGGFRVDSIGLIPRPTPLKTGVQAWLRLFADFIIGKLTDEEAALFLDAVEEEVRPELFSESEGWTADYVRLRFLAHKV